MKRVIVCGGRDYDDRDRCFEVLNELFPDKAIEIVSGHAAGADSFGEAYANENGIKLTVFRPDWKQYGRAAGPIRNKAMLDYAVKETPVVVAFWDGKSKGTKNMIDLAEKVNAEDRKSVV